MGSSFVSQRDGGVSIVSCGGALAERALVQLLPINYANTKALVT